MRTTDIGHYLALAGETAKRFEAEVRHLARRARELAARSASLRESPARDASDTIEALLGELDARDAELALAETQLQEVSDAFLGALALLGRERTRSFDLFDAASSAYLVTDRRGVIDEANTAAARLFAVPHAAMSGRLVISFVARQDTRRFREWLLTLDAAADLHQTRVRLRPRGGAPFLATVAVRFVPGLWGRSAGLRWMMTPDVAAAAAPAHAVMPSETLRRRMLLAVEELKTTLAAVQAWSRVLHDGIKETTEHSETIEAIAQAAVLPTRPLEELEQIAREVDGEGPGLLTQ
ncbi:MAG TPA: PAS domain-containing protein [Polyangiaceae bacterium]